MYTEAFRIRLVVEYGLYLIFATQRKEGVSAVAIPAEVVGIVIPVGCKHGFVTAKRIRLSLHKCADIDVLFWCEERYRQFFLWTESVCLRVECYIYVVKLYATEFDVVLITIVWSITVESERHLTVGCLKITAEDILLYTHWSFQPVVIVSVLYHLVCLSIRINKHQVVVVRPCYVNVECHGA